MARRGRSPSPSARSPVRSPNRVQARAPARAPAAVPATTQPQQTSPAIAQQQQPSMFKQMAATAGGVAVGSAIGHTVGHAMTGMFSGGSDGQVAAPAGAQYEAAPAQYPAGTQTEPTGACAWEIKQFLQCAQQQDDLSLCSGFNEAIRQCKETNHMV